MFFLEYIPNGDIETLIDDLLIRCDMLLCKCQARNARNTHRDGSSAKKNDDENYFDFTNKHKIS